MKIKAIKPYRDIHENKMVQVGDVYSTTNERASLIVSKGYAIYQEEVVKPKEETTTTLKKKEKVVYGLWNSLKDFLFEDEIVDFTNEVSDGETVQGTDQAATWQSASSFWQLSYAQNVVANILASYLTNLEWKTYKQGELKRVKNGTV